MTTEEGERGMDAGTTGGGKKKASKTGDDLYQQVIRDYKETGSVEKTARNCHLARATAQKILITEGLWSSRTSRRVAGLLRQGRTVKEIAQELLITEKTVQAYTPYTRGMYSGDTEDAGYSQDYRERMQTAAANMHRKSAESNETYEEREERMRKAFEEEELKKPFTDDDSRAALTFTDEELERVVMDPGSLWNRKGQEQPAPPAGTRAYHLRLELIPDQRWDKDLAEYLGGEAEKRNFLALAKAEQGITREVLVPGDMNLHALHYAIQEAFGWQNSHLHSFCLSEEEFNRLTADRVGGYQDLCGVLFRCDSEDTDDLYWDDDYRPGMSVRTWIRRKYSRPFRHCSVTDTRYQGQRYEMWLRKRHPEITEEMRVSVLNREHFGELFCDELMEGLRVEDIFRPDSCGGWSSGEVREWKEYVMAEAWYQDNRFYYEVSEAYEKDDAWEEESREGRFDGDDRGAVDINIDHLVQELRAARTSRSITEQKIWEDQQTGTRDGHKFVEDQIGSSAEEALLSYICQVSRLEYRLDPLFTDYVVRPLPFTKELLYRYDYGDDWWVRITLVGTEDTDIRQARCVSADGLNLVDDCGGISGYYEFLKAVYGSDPEEKERMKQWARGLGWTGRKRKPENML